jgi:transcriptional regulator with XRE-family HTH domain
MRNSGTMRAKVIVPKVPADPHKIRRIMFDRRLVQTTVAREAGIDRTTLSKQLAGTRPIDIVDLVRLSLVLGVSWEDLLVDACDGCGAVHCFRAHEAAA